MCASSVCTTGQRLLVSAHTSSRDYMYSPVQQDNTSGASEYRMDISKVLVSSPQYLCTLVAETEALHYEARGIKYH